MPKKGHLQALLQVGLCSRICAAGEVQGPGRYSGAVRSFSVYSDPLWLRPGEVHNAFVRPKPLPRDIVEKFANKTMHLKGVQLDIVRLDAATGKEIPLPLYEVYNHHHALIMGPADDLEALYNRTRGKDPLHPHAQARRGCMMHGASIKMLLDEVAAAGSEGTHPHPYGRRPGRIASFGGASGAEFRGTSTWLPYPFSSPAESPESFLAILHFISMRGAQGAGEKRWECPCTSARKIDPENGTIDGQKPLPYHCSEELLREGNTACGLKSYTGGYRCCEHGVFLTENLPGPDAPRDEIQAKYTFTYYQEDEGEVLAPQQGEVLRATRGPACCDATGSKDSHGNIEYDVPICAAGTPKDRCEHQISSVQYFDMPPQTPGGGAPKVDPDEELELVHAWGHQHVGAISLELYNEQTGALLCRTEPKYGMGEAPGDEKGFVVGIPPCRWGPPPLPPPPRLRRGDLVRTVARYNSSEAHRGVMSLWLMDAAPVVKPGPPESKLEPEKILV